MFSLAMLVRLGRITEDDVKATFAAFRRLDVGNYGYLNSRTIIEGELMRRRAISYKNLASAATEPPNQHSSWDESQRKYTGEHFVFSNPPNYTPEPDYSRSPVIHGSPNPFLNPISVSTGSLVRRQSIDSNYSSRISESRLSEGAISLASSFDFDAYERWAAGWGHYDATQSNQRQHR